MALLATTTGAGLLAGSNLLNANNSYGNSWSEASESSESGSQGSSWSHTLGSEASAADILRANEANDLQSQYLLAQMQYNSSEAEKTRNWEQAMSNTAYQRQVKDLIAAGLNPILAVGTSGASTPTVANATGGLQSAYKANTYADSYSGSQNSSYSSSKGNSRSESNNKSETQLNSFLKAIGQGAKGVAEGITKGLTEYSWEGAIRN